MARLLRFLFGCALGATVAVLVTPKSGRDVRRQLLSAARPVLLTRGPAEHAEPQDERPGTWSAEPAAEEPAATAAAEEEAAAEWYPASDAADIVLASEEPAWEWSPTGLSPSEPEAVEEAPAPEETPAPKEPLVVEEAAVSEEESISDEEAAVVEEAPAEAADESSMPADLGDLRRRIAAAREALESAVAQPARTQPTTGEWFGASETVRAEPGVEPPAPKEPVAEEPAVEEAAVEEPVAEELVVEETAPEESMIEEAPLEMFLVKEPTVEEPPPMPVAEEPSTESRAAYEPPTVEPRPAYEPPTAEQQPAVEEAPAADEASVEEAALEATPSADVAAPPAELAPTAREGAIDPAEMRRRIEETRARLKAKAFDAMMSGEAALLSRDSGEESVPREADVGVGDDVAQTIEEGLSEDDA